jgi:hypothetical protein
LKTGVALEIALLRLRGRVSLRRLIVTGPENVIANGTETETGTAIAIGSPKKGEKNTLNEIVTGPTEAGILTSEVTSIPNEIVTEIAIAIESGGEAKAEAEVDAVTEIAAGTETGVATVTGSVLDPAIDIGMKIETETVTETAIRIGSATEIMIETGAADEREVHPAGISVGAAEAPETSGRLVRIVTPWH